MKKLITPAAAILFVLSTLTSCKKSSHCIIKDSSGSTIKDYGVKSGTSTDVKNYENSCKADAGQYAGTLTCN